MSQHCEIHELFSDGSQPCPVCTSASAADAERDAWEELRRLAGKPKRDPLLGLSFGGGTRGLRLPIRPLDQALGGFSKHADRLPPVIAQDLHEKNILQISQPRFFHGLPDKR